MMASTSTTTLEPPRKRIRTGKTSQKSSSSLPTNVSIAQQRLYAPFRALGLVTNHVPFAIQTRRANKGSAGPPRVHILTCLGKEWLMWEGERMTLLFVGESLEDPITSLLFDGDAVWASSGRWACKFLRGKQVSRLENPLETTLSTLLVFGSRMLALTEDGTHLLVWDMESLELVNSITFAKDFTATHVLHPATYLNKVLVGSREGGLELWNISTGIRIHAFSPSSLLSSTKSSSSSSHSQPSSITALVQSPAVDVVGIGFASGEVVIYDIRADERLLGVSMGAGTGAVGGEVGRVTSIAFRSDGEPILATSSSTGSIALWDLNARASLLHMQRGAHEGSITAMEWIPGQALLVSAGEENCVKQWTFDTPTSPPRLLKFRSGHQAPPHLIRYFGADGKQILTASRDRSLRCTSVVRDSRSYELSQGSVAKKSTSTSLPLSTFKFPPITSLAFSSTRSKDWEDVLTAHSSLASDPSSSSNPSSFARTWTVGNKRVGRWALGLSAPGVDSRGLATLPASKRNDPASVITKSKKKANTDADGGSVRSVFVTSCGNFGLVGSSRGRVVMWNMQSGIRRRVYDTKRDNDGKERSAVTGVAVDPLNRTMVACTLSGGVYFFDFHTSALQAHLQLPSSAVSLTLQPDSGLFAITCDDLTVRLIDLETKRVVREFGGFKGRILDLAFSPDSRWLIITSLDSVIRTFDIPTGKLINAFRTASVCTSLSFSPTGDFLATAHVGSVGVYLWANRAQYAEVALQSFDESLLLTSAATALPSVRDETDEDDALEALTALRLDDEGTKDVYSTPDQLDEELVTLTLLPRSKWVTLLNLETITQRNKPKEAPKAPERAPFFLPTLPGVEHRFDLDTDESSSNAGANAKDGDAARKNKGSMVEIQSEFQRRLMDEDREGDYESLFLYLKTLSPASIDLELRSLTDSPFSARKYLVLFIHALSGRLRSHRDFEAVQTFMAVLLRVHGAFIVEQSAGDDGEQEEEAEEGEDVSRALEELRDVQREESSRLLELVERSLGTLYFVRDAT